MIDLDFEDRLIERLDARAAIRSSLSPRQKRVLALHVQGNSLRDIGKVVGVGPERIRQIFDKSIRNLQHAVTREPEAVVVGRVIPPTFDRAAFLDHMRLLIELRATEEQRLFEQERAELARLVRREKDKKQAVADAKAVYHESPIDPGQYLQIPSLPVHYEITPPPPPPIPTGSQLNYLAQQALAQLMFIRQPEGVGLAHAGMYRSGVTFPRIGGELSMAVNRLSDEIPHSACLSACPLEIPSGMLAGQATNEHASLTITMSGGGETYGVYVTWADGQTT